MGELAALLNGSLDSGFLAAAKALLGSFVFAQVIAWTYEFTFRGVSYSRGFSHTLILATLASTVVMLALGHSLIAGLGLLGVLSMIRFRTTLKAPRDLIFVMGGVAVGTATGINALTAALAGTVAFCATAIYLHRSPFGSRAEFDGVLRFRVPVTAPVEPRLSELLGQHCRRRSLLSIGEVAQGTRLEHAYEVQLRSDQDRDSLLTALRNELSAADARLLLQDSALEY